MSMMNGNRFVYILLFSFSVAFASKDLPNFGGGFSLGRTFSDGNGSQFRYGLLRGRSFLSRMCGGCENHMIYGGWQMDWKSVSLQFLLDTAIAAAYISVPLQLYFILKDVKPISYKPPLVLFGAFTFLLGFSHFLNLWSLHGLSEPLMLLLTTVKLLAACVACAMALTITGVFPDVLGLYDREVALRQHTEEVDAGVLTLLRSAEICKGLNRVSSAIRSSLDRTVVCSRACQELRAMMRLENVGIWMPMGGGSGRLMRLVVDCSQLKSTKVRRETVLPLDDPALLEITSSNAARVVPETCQLATLTWQVEGGASSDPVSVAAVPFPILGTADLASLEASGRSSLEFGVLVMVMSARGGRQWSQEHLRASETVSDQLAIALAHSSVLEESERVKEQLTVQQSNLRLAELEGKSAVRARDNFLTVMKHEMRTPMHSITALSSLLAEADLEDSQRAMVATVARSSTLLATLVSDILEFWRLEGEGGASLALLPEAFELQGLAREAETLVGPIAQDQGVRFQVQLGEGGLPGRVSGDSNRLLQVLLNVIGNAVKATARGGSVGLWVGMERMESSRDGFVLKAEAGFVFVRFEVRDGGEDLPPAEVPRLFEKFQDSDARYVRTGLGLALSKKFVQLHEGHIWMESGGPGGGAVTRFVVRLKLEEEGAGEDEEEESWEVPDVNFYALRIMVVDDNMINRLVTKRLLESIGSQTKVVDSGKECLRLLKERSEAEDPYDVLLLDLMMPEMDGYTTATKILEEVPEKDRPIIVALTANADESTQERCMEHGMVGMITKPISLNPLRDILGKMLDKNAKK